MLDTKVNLLTVWAMVLASKVPIPDYRLSATAADTTLAHEPPYLNNGNHQAIFYPAMTFTNEPYLEGRFGIRHEDIYLVKSDGEAEVLSGRRAILA